MKKLTILRTTQKLMAGMALLLTLLGGCQEDRLPDEVQTLEDAYGVIVGEWEWTKSLLIDRRVGTIVQTPESEGLAKQIEFGRNRTMQFTENGTVVRNSEYRIEASENSFGLRVIETGARLVIQIKADTLILSNSAFGDAHYYIRK